MAEPELHSFDERPTVRPQRDVLSLVLLGLAVLYGISPIDLSPDMIPVLGQLDDAGLLLAALLNAFQKNSAYPSSLAVAFAKYAKWVALLGMFAVLLVLGGGIALIVLAIKAVVGS